MSFSKLVIVLSSAKLFNEDYIKPIRSFINMLNSNGPKIDPWGTPESNVLKVLCMLFKLMHCFLRFK